MLIGVSTFGAITIAVAALIVLLLVINPKAVKKVWFNLRSLVGAGADEFDSKNAVKNMNQSVKDAKDEIQGYVDKLNESQGQIDSLTRESVTANGEVTRLTSRVHERAAQVNNDNTDPILLDLAKQLKAAQIRATDATNNLASQTGTHNDVLVQVQDAVLRADILEKDAARMGVQLDLSATRASLASVGLNIQTGNHNTALSDAEQYKEMIQKQIDTNNGAVKVAKQLNPNAGSVATAAWEREQDAKSVLAGMGIGDTKPAYAQEVPPSKM